MSISIVPDLETRLRARASAEGITVERYLERIALDDQRAEEELESLAIEGLNSGDAVPGDGEFWDERQKRLKDRQSKRNTR